MKKKVNSKDKEDFHDENYFLVPDRNHDIILAKEKQFLLDLNKVSERVSHELLVKNRGGNSCSFMTVDRTGDCCNEELSCRNSFCDKFTKSNTIDLSNLGDHYPLALEFIKKSSHLRIICSASIAFNKSLKQRTSKLEVQFKGLVTSQNNGISSPITGCKPIEYSEIAHLQERIMSTGDENGKTESVLRSPIYSNSPNQYSNSSSRTPSAMDDRKISSWESDSSLVIVNDTSSHKPVTLSKGLIHCSWKDGLPHFVFSLDDSHEVLVAKPQRVEFSGEKALDFIYFFHLRSNGEKSQQKAQKNSSNLIGKMTVSSRSNPVESEFFDSNFVLYGAKEDQVRCNMSKMASSSPYRSWNKGAQKKAGNIFGTYSRFQHSPLPKFRETNVKLKELNWENPLDASNKQDCLVIDNPLGENMLPNLELASILVKCHNSKKTGQEATIGGWGLKFLEKTSVDGACNSPSQSKTNNLEVVSFKNCNESVSRNEGKMIAGMTVLVPAGFHGGPRTRNGGPSSLYERWESGHCDCGGWDMGCPLTVMNLRERNDAKVVIEVDTKEDCQSFELYIKGSKKGVPAVKLVNIHEGLYFIYFQSNLSALQSFSIGMAMIHAQSPGLPVNHVQQMK
ncbi:uncharacterized protein LOC18444239 [Amborella trichopoda]|uniref:Uncharacterized protein n=1 Tax=Amborella trichopoda TaxID=13333 RepID=U5D6F4_AMBTC|nr:uncharacterized protein LOC18444239 [Amborella trichopoda]ERN15943.1 hypothetical protein AMTR_s00039p00237690 [Amborella trichopoda]|eukprot:XP_020529211.1 uncharacterized protein LOC18444239 [Amborella trichopoda]